MKITIIFTLTIALGCAAFCGIQARRSVSTEARLSALEAESTTRQRLYALLEAKLTSLATQTAANAQSALDYALGPLNATLAGSQSELAEAKKAYILTIQNLSADIKLIQKDIEELNRRTGNSSSRRRLFREGS